MPITRLIKEFGTAFELANLLRSELWNLNGKLVESDSIGTLNDYKKVKATFKDLKVAMTDLERAVSKISGEIPDLPPNPGVDPSS